MAKQRPKTKTKPVSQEVVKLPSYEAEIAALENAQSIIELKAIVMGFEHATSAALGQVINDNAARIAG